MSSRNRLIFFSLNPYSGLIPSVFRGICTMRLQLSSLFSCLLSALCDVPEVLLSPVPLCGSTPCPFALLMETKQNTTFYFMPGSLSACVLVNPLWPQQLPCRTSAKCWPPPWPLLWPVLFCQSITGVFKATLTSSSIGHNTNTLVLFIT